MIRESIARFCYDCRLSCQNVQFGFMMDISKENGHFSQFIKDCRSKFIHMIIWVFKTNSEHLSKVT